MYLVPWPFQPWYNMRDFLRLSMPLLFDWLRIVYQSNSTSLGLWGQYLKCIFCWQNNSLKMTKDIPCNFKYFSFTSFHTPFFFWYTPFSPICLWEPSDWCDCFWVRHESYKAAHISPPYKSQMWREANNTLASHRNVTQIIDHNIWRVVCTKKQK